MSAQAAQEAPECLRGYTDTGRRRPGRPTHHRPFDLADLERLLPGRCVLDKARCLGTSAHNLYRWRRSGLTVERADELAVAAGFHPSEVWSEWWEDRDGIMRTS